MANCTIQEKEEDGNTFRNLWAKKANKDVILLPHYVGSLTSYPDLV